MNSSKIKQFIVALSITGILFTMSGCKPEKSLTVNTMNQKNLSQAIETSKKELQQKGFKLEEMQVEADEQNTAWKKLSTQQPTVLQNPLVKKMELEKKVYWAMYFGPTKQMLGGDAWVFIDKNSGETIGIILGK